MECGAKSFVQFWTDGGSSSQLLRWLYGSNTRVLLVSTVLVCTNNHKTLMHDERIHKHLPCQMVVPCVLFHRMGFTKECANSINFASFVVIIIILLDVN